jgi:hypothetical protein
MLMTNNEIRELLQRAAVERKRLRKIWIPAFRKQRQQLQALGLPIPDQLRVITNSERSSTNTSLNSGDEAHGKEEHIQSNLPDTVSGKASEVD